MPACRWKSSPAAITRLTSVRPTASTLVSLAGGRAPMDHDFELLWRPVPSAQPRAMAFSETINGEPHYLLMVVPPEVRSGFRRDDAARNDFSLLIRPAPCTACLSPAGETSPAARIEHAASRRQVQCRSNLTPSTTPLFPGTASLLTLQQRR